MRMRNLVAGLLGVVGVLTVLFLPVHESVPIVSLSGPRASVFQEWVNINLAAMKAPDATFDSVEKDLSTPILVASLDGEQKYFRSGGCSVRCTGGCTARCTNTCSSNSRCRE